ncbi:immunoglobulin-like domain-containing protein [Paenibacillus sp. CF384]|uniref:immunoglobulin-like domain-containing protein n=1 Tax=Paenibacillus sp. CF384 TaxID=1884382 RepID=UPI00089C8570|nr:immunoglobulin-like domain-containing protein [Paenibacillus sp. CF384]SDW12077.1 hypothetical protein SAMN05518855_1001328 [Paenibacillus sp. CF384]
MKKWTVIMLVLSMCLLGSSTALAHGNSHGSGNDSRQQQLQSCKDAVNRLNAVLVKVKNERTRAILKRMIANFKAECESGTNGDSTYQKDLAKVNADKNALSIQFIGNDNAKSVTLPIILSSKGKNGSAITWTSSNPSILASNGLLLNRPDYNDVAIDMTATIRYGNAQTTKTFRIIIKSTAPVMSDIDRVKKDYAALSIVFGGSDTIDSVTQPFKELPSKGVNGSTVTWESTMPSVISNDGKRVVRPPTGSGSTIVIFTAQIRSGSYKETKVFIVKVKEQMPDAQRVAADKAALQIDFGGSDSAGRVTRPVDAFPAYGVNGSSIKWMSSSTAVLSDDGKTLHRPAASTGDTFVLVSAVITSGSAVDVKQFTLTVKAEYTSTEKVAADKADLAITYKDSDNAGYVTKPLGLPSKGYYGSSVIWYSSNTAVLSDNGTVLHRPAHGQGDISVNLTAFVSHNGIGDVKVFTVTVKQQ